MRRQRENRITPFKETSELRSWIASGQRDPGSGRFRRCDVLERRRCAGLGVPDTRRIIYLMAVVTGSFLRRFYL